MSFVYNVKNLDPNTVTDTFALELSYDVPARYRQADAAISQYGRGRRSESYNPATGQYEVSTLATDVTPSESRPEPSLAAAA